MLYYIIRLIHLVLNHPLSISNYFSYLTVGEIEYEFLIP